MIDTRQRFRLPTCKTSAAKPNTQAAPKAMRKRCIQALYSSAEFGDFGRLAWGIPKSVVDAWTKGVCGADILPIHT